MARKVDILGTFKYINDKVTFLMNYGKYLAHHQSLNTGETRRSGGLLFSNVYKYDVIIMSSAVINI